MKWNVFVYMRMSVSVYMRVCPNVSIMLVCVREYAYITIYNSIVV